MKRFEGTFEVDTVRPRKLRNGNRMQIVLEAPYDETLYAELVHYNFMAVKVSIEEDEEGQQDLFEGGEDEG